MHPSPWELQGFTIDIFKKILRFSPDGAWLKRVVIGCMMCVHGNNIGSVAFLQVLS